ncbi:hypothetical protein [Legionella maioricensis]|uniref:Uncharacterized protein n=1 Tax=Legionella maioricensis TaxID=2896528 RepID=A0A9X2CZH6_9GAMM|nr:hypothetical protein [Legionella maioricensis]MCL9683373.1 hypothetical protein [Legionella maioricensis]MCL9685931.1 hypothetical protein [Legionella maioricensis]
MQQKEDKIEIAPELIQYASDVVKNNYTCRDVRKWLEGHQHNIESFFIALTLVKKGNLKPENYKEVAQEFLDKFKTEIITNWSPRFQSAPQPKAADSILTGNFQEEVVPLTLSFI